LKVSIITATYNSAATVADTLRSVEGQTYSDIEHIVIDGMSKDDTLDIVRLYPHISRVVSEGDKGIYDAINKGINIATGDIIGILNSDDFLSSPDVIAKIVAQFDDKIDAFIGDIAFVNPSDTSRVIRYYSSSKWVPKLFRWGFMPAHPSFYLKKNHYKSFGLYKMGYKIAADYELLIRMLYIHKLNYIYKPMQVVTMRTGGISTQSINSRYTLNKEIVQACRENGIYTNMFFLIFKYFVKVFEYIRPSRKR
jgi:glycosyltransferase involved in cell wall biosynthesis